MNEFIFNTSTKNLNNDTFTIGASKNGTKKYGFNTIGVANNNGSLNSGCMKWYTFLDSESNNGENATVNMILDHNTTAKVAWNSSGTNVSGPNQVLNALFEY